jgi:hypothetical protein
MDVRRDFCGNTAAAPLNARFSGEVAEDVSNNKVKGRSFQNQFVLQSRTRGLHAQPDTFAPVHGGPPRSRSCRARSAGANRLF